MYQTTAPLSGVGGALAYTGTNSLWLALAGFTLIAAGGAVMRLVPRKTA